MDFFIILIFCVIIILIVYFLCYKFYFYYKSEYVKSNIDNQYYLVKNTKNKYKKADLMAILFQNINMLLDYLENNSIKLNNKNIDYQKIKNIIKNSEIIENITNSDTSYTINKGEKIIICLANRKTDNLYDINLIMYVLLHELAHIINSTYGHDKNFKTVFKELVDNAIKIKIYKYENYKESPQEYCGMELNTNIIKIN